MHLRVVLTGTPPGVLVDSSVGVLVTGSLLNL